MASGDLERGGGSNVKNRGNSYNQSSSSSYYVENNEKQWTSWLVPMFVVANIAVFVVVMYVNNCPKNNQGFEGGCVARFLGRLSFEPLKENPLFGPSSNTLEKLGALNWEKVVHGNQAWRLITSIWLHAGVIHLLANMLSLIFIGIRLEQQFGFIRVGLIYLLSGFGGSVLSSLFIQRSISVGASGALFGLLGAMLSELLTNWTIYTNKAAALITLVVIIVINLAVGILPHVDNFAHIGGFLTGFLLGFVLLLRPQFGWVGRKQLPAGARVTSKHPRSPVDTALSARLRLAEAEDSDADSCCSSDSGSPASTSSPRSALVTWADASMLSAGRQHGPARGLQGVPHTGTGQVAGDLSLSPPWGSAPPEAWAWA